MLRLKITVPLIFASFVFFFAFSPAEAIIIPAGNIGQNLSITVRPENPKPYDEISISLTSPSFDINTAEITWIIDGKVAGKGVGKKTFSSSVGASGVRMRIDIVVKPFNEEVLTRSFDIFPASVDIIWQANTYTPFFYKGRALPTTEGSVTFTALPNIAVNGSKVSAENLLYEWTRNSRVLGSLSGYGKNRIVVRSSLTDIDERISVRASTADGGVVASDTETVTLGDPKIIFYEDHPLYGLNLGRAIRNETELIGKEATFLAVPYFFSVTEISAPSLVYKWLINGREGTLSGSRESITLRNENNKEGQARISLNITDSSRTVVYALSEFLIKFGGNSSI